MSPQSVPHPAPSRRLPRLLLSAGLFLTLPLAAGGCVGISVGDILGAAGSVVGTGKEVFSLGKLNSAQMASLPQTVDAARQAAQDLRLTCKSEAREDDQTTHLEFADDKCCTVTVTVEPRTVNLVRIQIDVGIFGSEPTARLFLARVRAHLPGGASPIPRTDDS